MQGLTTRERDSGSVEQYHSACSTVSALQVCPAGIAQSRCVPICTYWMLRIIEEVLRGMRPR